MKKYLLAALFAAQMASAQAFEFPIVKLVDGGLYSNYSTIVETVDADYSRMINFENVAFVRRFEENGLLVDGKTNIKFKNSEERSQFLRELEAYIRDTKKPIVITDKADDEKLTLINKLLAGCTIILSLMTMWLVVPEIWKDVKRRWGKK